MDSKPWYMSKTIWVSIFGALYALAQFVAGQIDLNALVLALQVALSAWGLRLGIDSSLRLKK